MRAVFLIVLLFLSPKLLAQVPFPTNATGKTVRKFDSLDRIKALTNFEGKFYAGDVKIVRVEKAYQGKPYFVAEFEDGEQLWIASLLKTNFVQPGRIVRILGSLSTVKEADNLSKKYNNKSYHLLLFALLDWETKKIVSFEGGIRQAEIWRDGKIPEALADD